MTDNPWEGDACSLVDAFRARERSPVEELEATLAGIGASDLNSFSHVDPERAMQVATSADVSLPFGGVPTAIKQLDPVEGWPLTEASLVFEHRVATYTSHQSERLFARGGVVPVGQTTASEFGGLNISVSKINGVTHNPWHHGRTVGGSSGGSAAAVAGGLVSLATGGDGGGSIRIPAGYTGLLGMKGTYGRIPRGPHAYMRPNTVVLGNLSRSVRDAARFYDVCAGLHPYDPTSLPSHGRWEAGLGTHELTGRRVAIVPNLGETPLEPGVEDQLRAEAKALIEAAGMVEVDLQVRPPNLAAQWAMGNLATLLADLGDRWPACSDELTDEIAVGLHLAESVYNLRTAAVAEEIRIQANEAMAAAFGQVDLIIAATNPGPAFPAEASTSNPQAPIIEKVFGGGRRATACGRPSVSCGCSPLCSRSCRRRASARPTGACPTSPTWGASRSSRTCTGTPPCRSRPAPSTDCPSACRCSPGTTKTSSSSTSRSPSSASARGPWWLRPLGSVAPT